MGRGYLGRSAQGTRQMPVFASGFGPKVSVEQSYMAATMSARKGFVNQTGSLTANSGFKTTRIQSRAAPVPVGGPGAFKYTQSYNFFNATQPRTIARERAGRNAWRAYYALRRAALGRLGIRNSRRQVMGSSALEAHLTGLMEQIRQAQEGDKVNKGDIARQTAVAVERARQEWANEATSAAANGKLAPSARRAGDVIPDVKNQDPEWWDRARDTYNAQAEQLVQSAAATYDTEIALAAEELENAKSVEEDEIARGELARLEKERRAILDEAAKKRQQARAAAVTADNIRANGMRDPITVAEDTTNAQEPFPDDVNAPLPADTDAAMEAVPEEPTPKGSAPEAVMAEPPAEAPAPEPDPSNMEDAPRPNPVFDDARGPGADIRPRPIFREAEGPTFYIPPRQPQIGEPASRETDVPTFQRAPPALFQPGPLPMPQAAADVLPQGGELPSIAVTPNQPPRSIPPSRRNRVNVRERFEDITPTPERGIQRTRRSTMGRSTVPDVQRVADIIRRREESQSTQAVPSIGNQVDSGTTAAEEPGVRDVAAENAAMEARPGPGATVAFQNVASFERALDDERQGPQAGQIAAPVPQPVRGAQTTQEAYARAGINVSPSTADMMLDADQISVEVMNQQGFNVTPFTVPDAGEDIVNMIA